MSMSPVDPFSELAERAPEPSDRILAALRTELERDGITRKEPSSGSTHGKVRTRLQRTLLSSLALGIALLFSTLSAWSSQPRLLLLTAAAYSLAVGAALFAGAIPGNMSAWSHGPRRALLGVLSLAVFVLLALQADAFIPVKEFFGGAAARMAIPCFSHALFSGALVSTVLMALWKKTDPFSPGLTGALLGFFGGAVGTLSVEISCASTEGLHLTLAHGLATVLLAAVGFLVGRKWLTP